MSRMKSAWAWIVAKSKTVYAKSKTGMGFARAAWPKVWAGTKKAGRISAKLARMGWRGLKKLPAATKKAAIAVFRFLKWVSGKSAGPARTGLNFGIDGIKLAVFAAVVLFLGGVAFQYGSDIGAYTRENFDFSFSLHVQDDNGTVHRLYPAPAPEVEAAPAAPDFERQTLPQQRQPLNL